MEAAPYGQRRDAARDELPWPHERNRANDAPDHQGDKGEHGETEELVTSTPNWADNLVLHVLHGERPRELLSCSTSTNMRSDAFLGIRPWQCWTTPRAIKLGASAV